MDLAEVLSLWWVYPAALCIATLAISTGISGALFFVPFFLLVVGVSPAEAIGGGLMTMIFGTASGTFSYVRQGVVDFTIVKSLLLVTVPFAMAGAVVSLMIDPDALRVLFGVLLFALYRLPALVEPPPRPRKHRTVRFVLREIEGRTPPQTTPSSTPATAASTATLGRGAP